MPTDTACINQVRLLQMMRDAGMLRDVSIGQMHILQHRFGLLIDVPSDDAHLSCITKRSPSALNLLFLVCSMNEIVTRLTQGNQIIRAIPARLPALDMVDIQDRVFRLTLAPLAGMSITKQDILTHIPKAQLRPLLILLALYLRVTDLLNVELCYLD